MVIVISHVNDESQLFRVWFWNNAKTAHDVGMTPVWRAEAALASIISRIALVTNSWFSNADLEFGISLAVGAVVTHSRS